MVRAQAPVRAELRPRRRDEEQRRLRAALGQRTHEIERSRVGPVQVLEGDQVSLDLIWAALLIDVNPFGLDPQRWTTS